MQKKTFIILGSIFLILLIGASFPLWKTYVPFQKKISANDVFGFSSLSESAATSFSIQQGEDKKVFTKKGSDWFLNDKKVVFENVRLFFEGFQKAETKERVAKNPENHKDLGVTKEQGYVVTFTQDKEKTVMYIVGNSTLGETTYYMRKDGSDDVYAVTSATFYKLSDAPEAWIEKLKEESKKEVPPATEKKK